MDVRILYLDVDDEITTAANRVREAEGTRVAMVLPGGSRVATSRINFRLLSRDATLNGKRLAIVAGDAATRALAASAGLPVFANVNEYESSFGEDGGTVAALPDAPVAERDDERPAIAATAPKDGPPPPRSPRGSAGRKPRGDGVPAAAPVVAAAAAVRPATEVVPEATDGAPTRAHRPPSTIPAARVISEAPGESVKPERVRDQGAHAAPASRVRLTTPALPRTPILIGAAILALALVVGGVGAYVFLPTATAVIAPRESVIGPMELRVVADPNATAADPVTRTIPAVTKDVPVEATETFQVTGKRVEETAATGTVRFRNKDFTSTNTIPRGSIVSTQGGLRFRTERAITVPRAELVGLQVFPASAAVKVRAVNAGPEGNVEPNTILVIPRGEDPLTLDVTNPERTTGGKRDEFPRVVQADITAATKAIEARLASTFAERLADPGLTADGTTVFDDTAVLGEPVFAIDPASLLGEEVETFELGATATGTVLAVDESAVQTVAEENIAPQVEAGHALVEGSSEVVPSPGQVDGGIIAFAVTITARQILQVDPETVESEIRGRTLADAQAILDRYGTSELAVWPDWVGTIPTLDARVDVRIAEADGP